MDGAMGIQVPQLYLDLDYAPHDLIADAKSAPMCVSDVNIDVEQSLRRTKNQLECVRVDRKVWSRL